MILVLFVLHGRCLLFSRVDSGFRRPHYYTRAGASGPVFCWRCPGVPDADAEVLRGDRIRAAEAGRQDAPRPPRARLTSAGVVPRTCRASHTVGEHPANICGIKVTIASSAARTGMSRRLTHRTAEGRDVRRSKEIRGGLDASAALHLRHHLLDDRKVTGEDDRRGNREEGCRWFAPRGSNTGRSASPGARHAGRCRGDESDSRRGDAPGSTQGLLPATPFG